MHVHSLANVDGDARSPVIKSMVGRSVGVTTIMALPRADYKSPAPTGKQAGQAKQTWFCGLGPGTHALEWK